MRLLDRYVPETVTILDHRDGSVMDVYAQPRASRSEILGAHDGALRVRITAPPVEGAANEASVSLLSDYLGIRRTDIEIVSGSSSRRKRVLVRGVSLETLRHRLANR